MNLLKRSIYLLVICNSWWRGVFLPVERLSWSTLVRCWTTGRSSVARDAMLARTTSITTSWRWAATKSLMPRRRETCRGSSTTAVIPTPKHRRYICRYSKDSVPYLTESSHCYPLSAEAVYVRPGIRSGLGFCVYFFVFIIYGQFVLGLAFLKVYRCILCLMLSTLHISVSVAVFSRPLGLALSSFHWCLFRASLCVSTKFNRAPTKSILWCHIISLRM